MKTLAQLTGTKSNWPVIEELMARAVNRFEILPKDEQKAENSILALQQSVESLMGAVTYNTGGILIDGGWLRILGSGHSRLARDIAGWNLGRSHDEGEVPGYLMVADDVIGGIFAVNGNELGSDTGMMYYLAPDTVEWEALDVNYHEFLEFCFAGMVKDFYEYFRWQGWEEEIKHLSGDEALMFNPPLWEEIPDELKDREHSVLQMHDVYELLLEVNNLMAEFDEEDGDDEGWDEHDGCDCGDDDCDCEDGCDCEDHNHH